jgi:putative membrane protein
MNEMSTLTLPQNKKYNRLINIIALTIPIVVAVLLNPRIPKVELGEWTKMLPHLNGLINSLTAFTLLLGFYFIKQKNIAVHRLMMTISFCLGAVFLVSYVLYHLSNESTSFLGEGIIRPIYYFY